MECKWEWAKADRNQGGRVFARICTCVIHHVVPNKQEWLNVMIWINANGWLIPKHYIFKGTRMHDFNRICGSIQHKGRNNKALKAGKLKLERNYNIN